MAEASYVIRFASSRSASRWTSHEGETVLDAAFRQGISVMHGCKEGQCGSCKSLLIEGDIELLKYSTFALPDYERETDHILLCRTHAYSDIVVELLNYDEDLMRALDRGEANSRRR